MLTYADVCWRMLTYADVCVCWHMLTYAGVCWRMRMLTYADVCWGLLKYAGVCWRMLAYADVCWRMRIWQRLRLQCSSRSSYTTDTVPNLLLTQYLFYYYCSAVADNARLALHILHTCRRYAVISPDFVRHTGTQFTFFTITKVQLSLFIYYTLVGTMLSFHLISCVILVLSLLALLVQKYNYCFLEQKCNSILASYWCSVHLLYWYKGQLLLTGTKA